MEKNTKTNQELPNIHSENIKEEFYKWFENRGVLSDLRAYMRQLMVKALDESKKNGKIIQQRKASSSPKLQAINLLVVDYLFHEDYLYTVSVFASEAQILDSLPQYSQYVTQTVREQRWDPSSLPRFSQLETEDILDTLRLPPTLQEQQEATQAYLSSHESLLTCVVRTLASSYNQSLVQDHFRLRLPEETVEEHIECNHQLWSQEMENLLLLAGVKLSHIRRMQKKWAQTIEEEKQKSKKEVGEELTAQQAEWQQETEQRLRSEVLEQMQVEQQLLRERQSRVELRERGLASLAEQLTSVHDDINQRLSQLSLQSEELRMREARQQSDRIELEQRLSQLQIREEHLQLTYARLCEQSVDTDKCENKDNATLLDIIGSNQEKTDAENQDTPMKALSEEVERVSVYTQTVEPVVVAFTQTPDTTDHEQQTSIANDVDPELAHQLQMDREKINELQEENLELRAHALQQRHRIDELTNRAASLTSQLEESQTAVAVLSGQDSAVVLAPPPPALPAQNLPAFAVPTFGFNTPQRIGAGEESLLSFRHQQAAPRPDPRRRPLRFAFSQNPNPTSEESSPTDDVIQNARSRIQQLEQEGAAIQTNFQEFQNRLLTSDSFMFPPLGTSRIRNPVLRVRRSDITPYVRFSNVPSTSFPPNNNVFQPTQQTQAEDEHEDSSSDLSGFYEVEAATNTRRMFTHRNLRQFERWKQFKKKFQRRDVFDQHRRNIPVANTSSDDDENERRSNRRRHEVNRQRKSNDTPLENSHKAKTTESKSKTPEGNQNTSLGNHTKKEELEHTQPQNEPSLVDVTEKMSKESIPCLSKPIKNNESFSVEQNKLILEVEQTEKLIESVKALLEKQQNNQGSTLSNESLPLESLPKDSQSGSQNQVLNTNNSSILTVQNVNSPVQKRSNMLILEKTKMEPANNSLSKAKTDKDLHPIEKVVSDQSINNLHITSEEIYDLQENAPEPLTIPMLRLVSPGLNVENEDFLDGVHTQDVAEPEIDDRGTSTVTSCSDILRELNSCKTESSNSIISGGWTEHSKHSSDFWN